MSVGTKAYPVRFPPGQLLEIQMCILRRNMHTREEPWSFSDFVRIACREKVAKMARSRGKPEAIATGPLEEWTDSSIGRLKLPEDE